MRQAFSGKQERVRAAEQHTRPHRHKGWRWESWSTNAKKTYYRIKWATKGRWGLIVGWSVLVGGGIALFL
jgi:hypothetical protein